MIGSGEAARRGAVAELWWDSRADMWGAAAEATPRVAEQEGNDSAETAQRLDREAFAVAGNAALRDDTLTSLAVEAGLSSAGDLDVFSVWLEAGETLTLDVDSGGDGLGAAPEMIAFTRGPAGEFLGGGGYGEALVTVYARTAGYYSFELQTESGAVTDAYLLHLSLERTGVDPDAAAVLNGRQWEGLDLRYSFPVTAAEHSSGEFENYEALSAVQRAVVRGGLSAISGFTDLSFAEAAPGERRSAHLRYGMTDSTPVASAIGPGLGADSGGSIYHNSSGRFDNPVLGSHAFATFLHETGHALGLKHGHQPPAMSAEHDSTEFSIMTYRAYVGATPGLRQEEYGYAQSFMMYDIAALQEVYGADFETRAGATSYRWSATTGRMFVDDVGQMIPGANRVFLTVWDGGGRDTYDLSNYRNSVAIDLRPGEWTITSEAQLAKIGAYDGEIFARGNVANALLYRGDTRSLIENAVGGTKGDTIVGNQAANRLDGGAGDDRIDGGEGRDVLIGGAGRDVFLVDHALDRAVEASGGGYDEVRSAAASFTLAGGVEALVLTGAATAGHGNGLANRITGNDGANLLSGGLGGDVIAGGEGADRIEGDGGADRLRGGEGADRFVFDAALNRNTNVDALLDFSVADDTILLDRAVFGGIDRDGALRLSAFWAGTAALDETDRIVYDAATGRIFYDADGSGAAAAVLFAEVRPGLALTHQDFAAYSGG
ncbi:MAG TPA: M10 family metallopeptidase [Allosphingosinicella sp.]